MVEKQRKNSGGRAKGLANLKPFKKGESGNPKGRPEGARNRSTVLKELLATECDFTNPLTFKKERAELEKQLMVALIAKGKRGDVQAIREILDTVYGKAAQPITGELDVNMPSAEELKRKFAERRKAVEALDD